MIEEQYVFVEVRLSDRVHNALTEIATVQQVGVEDLITRICEREVTGCKNDYPDDLPSEPAEGGAE